SAPMVPVGMVAECVAIKSGLTEIVQTFEILRCELVVGELVVTELIVAELIVAELIVAELIVAELIVAKLIVAKLIVAKLIVGGKRVATSVFQIVTGSPPSISSHCVVVTEIMRSGWSVPGTQRHTTFRNLLRKEVESGGKKISPNS